MTSSNNRSCLYVSIFYSLCVFLFLETISGNQVRSFRVKSTTSKDSFSRFQHFRTLFQTQDEGGGVPAPQNRFPYMCLVKRSGSFKFMCGATLIDPYWIITAAHCVDPNREDASGTDAIIVCGVNDRHANNQENVYLMEKTVVHYLWDGTTVHGHDIAMVKLDRPSDLDLPRLVHENSLLNNRIFVALGWGKSNTFGEYHDTLHMVNDLDHVDPQVCNSSSLWNGLIKDSMFCAGSGATDTCLGDSGGPTILPDSSKTDISFGDPRDDTLVGLISFGNDPCGEVGFPGVYTSVVFYKEWIQYVMDNN